MHRCRCHLAPQQMRLRFVPPGSPAIKYGNAWVHFLQQDFKQSYWFVQGCRIRVLFVAQLIQQQCWYTGNRHRSFSSLQKNNMWDNKPRHRTLAQCSYSIHTDVMKSNWMKPQRPSQLPSSTRWALAQPHSVTPWIYLRSGRSFGVGCVAVKHWDTSRCKFLSQGPREESQQGRNHDRMRRRTCSSRHVS